MLATTSLAIGDLYAPKRAPGNTAAFEAALHELHVATQKARIDMTLERGGIVRNRAGQLSTPHQAILDTAASMVPEHDAAMHLRLAMRAALMGDDEAAGKSVRAAIESAVLHLADLNATALDLGEDVHFAFVPNPAHDHPSQKVAS